MLRDVDRDAIVASQKVVLWLKDLHGIAIRGNRMFLAPGPGTRLGAHG
jgi:hypothetical protein